MSRRPSIPASNASYDGLPYDKLKAIAFESDPTVDRGPRQWFDLALRHAETARQAERRGSKADMFVAYSRIATSYNNATGHPDTKALKATDRAWAQRLADFKPVSDNDSTYRPTISSTDV